MTGANPVAAEEPATPMKVFAPMLVAKMEPAICSSTKTKLHFHVSMEPNPKAMQLSSSPDTDENTSVVFAVFTTLKFASDSLESMSWICRPGRSLLRCPAAPCRLPEVYTLKVTG